MKRLIAERHPDQMLEEVRRMQRVPGIVFADDTGGRVPRIAGTGIEVWEVISTYLAVNGIQDRLEVAFHWLSSSQLRAALAYYEAYPEEIEARLEEERRILDSHGKV